MELGLIRKVDIDSEMQQSYLDYAMSVIVSRALPDARDGLKPVQRRILYAMYDMGLRADAVYKKSARIVGEVLGKYHPHGDMAVYEAMARQAQDFSMRYRLVDGQGNFGSVDGDPPAAMRYTEARLAQVAMEMLNQIDKNTVDFSGNFDQTLTEPTVLPSAIPNLLVNGATGIAVGMATNIPPHNLGEVVDALTYMLEKWEKLDDITVQDLLGFIQGPDFPTGGVIIQDAGGEGLMSAYGSGRGRVVVQARAHLEEMVRGRNRIIVTELPYQVNKAALIERIAELVRAETLEGIADLRDESDRQGMRIVIELSKTADPEKILRDLYKHTPMQTTFGIILLALVGGEPHMLSLKQALRVYLDHRLVVVRRRSEFELEKARQRAHILEGLMVALKNLDEVINLIRNAPDAEQARIRLMKRFSLSEIQAVAILDMPLRRLASLERKKIETEYKEVTALIKEIETLLKSPKKMRQVVGEELAAMKQKYGDSRRTLIIRLKEGATVASMLTTTDMTPDQAVWIGVSANGAISRTTEDSLQAFLDHRAPCWLLEATTHNTLYLVSDQGKAAAIPVHAIPEYGKNPEGVSVIKLSPLEEGDRMAAMFTLPPRIEGNGGEGGQYVVSVTRAGLVKKSATSELPGPLAHTFTLSKINDGDTLVDVRLTDGKAELVLATVQGMAIRFSEEDIRPMGLVAAGVGGIKLAAGDEIAGMEVLSAAAQVLLIASSGKAKRVALKEFPSQARYGQGVQAWKLEKGTSLAGITAGKPASRALIHLENGSTKTLRFSDVSPRPRAGQGELVAGLKGAGKVTGLTIIPDEGGSQPGPAVEKARKPAAASNGASASANGKVKTPQPAARKAPAGGKKAAPIKPAEGQKTRSARAAKPAAAEAPAKASLPGKPSAPPKPAPAAKARSAAKPSAGTSGKTTKTGRKEITSRAHFTRFRASRAPSGAQEIPDAWKAG